ncbi:MAG TPA: (Fe-S)-binding protein [Candidatus Thermoplasmatota archaeon]|nr:(Fe-S)-binding protein [Candidatus Thermoplasmatota archaeon]
MSKIDKRLDSKAQTTRDVNRYLDACKLYGSCMDACPVAKGAFTVEQLNEATRQGAKVPAVIKEFTWHCMQCGRCAPVCAAKLRRDIMVRILKHHLRREKPWNYKRYLLIRGPALKGFPRFLQRLYVASKKVALRDLAPLMEVRPTRPAEVLFYPGCYLYSPTTVRQTLRLLDHIGCSYEVLGGMSTCCGMPHLLQGEFELADDCMKRLQQDIARIHPHTILTACAECHEAITKIKSAYGEQYEVLSVIEYLTRHQHKFPRTKIVGEILVHESCRFSSKTPAGQAARQAAATFGTLVAPPAEHAPPCCFHWNHNQDPGNKQGRLAYLREMRAFAPVLACNCLTCYEEFKKLNTDITIIDIIQLYIDALQTPPRQG